MKRENSGSNVVAFSSFHCNDTSVALHSANPSSTIELAYRGGLVGAEIVPVCNSRTAAAARECPPFNARRAPPDR